MEIVIGIVRLVLGILAFRGARWAYAGFIALGLLYFPIEAGFDLQPRACQVSLNAALFSMSVRNYGHIVLFGLFFVMTCAQFRALTARTYVGAAMATLAMGAFVEIAQGLTGEGNCRARDLIPDMLGILAGLAIVLVLKRLGWKARQNPGRIVTAP